MPCLCAQLQRAINSESSQASRIFPPPPKMAEGYPSLSLIPYRLDGPGGGFDLVEAVIVEELRPDLQTPGIPRRRFKRVLCNLEGTRGSKADKYLNGINPMPGIPPLSGLIQHLALKPI